MLKDAIDYVYDNYIPKFNPMIGEGFTYSQRDSIVATVKSLLNKNLNRDIDPRLPKGFGFESARVLPPEKAYEFMANQSPKSSRGGNSAKDAIDISQNDVIYLECKFNLCEGMQPYTRILGIPFIRRGDLFHIRGVQYELTTVIKSKGLSVTSQGYFIDLGSNRVFFKLIPRSFLANNSHVHYFVPYSQQLHSSAKNAKKSCMPPLVGWLYAKYGIHETFRQYVGAEIEFVKLDDPKLNEYDPSEYTVCQQSLKGNIAPLDYAIVIPTKQLDDKATICIGTIFYMAETLSYMMDFEYIEEASTWKRILGKAIHPKDKSDSDIIIDITNHLLNIEVLIESGLQAELEMSHSDGYTTRSGKVQVEFNTIYDFLDFTLIYIIDNQATGEVASLYDRYLTTIEYLTSDISKRINYLKWDLISKAKDEDKRQVGNPVSYNSIKDSLNVKMVHYLPSELVRGTHPEISVFSTTTDNMVIGRTSSAMTQIEAANRGKKASTNLYDKSGHADESFAEIGSIVFTTKPSPYGWAHLNMTATYDERGKLLRKPHLKSQMMNTRQDLLFKGI